MASILWKHIISGFNQKIELNQVKTRFCVQYSTRKSLVFLSNFPILCVLLTHLVYMSRYLYTFW